MRKILSWGLASITAMGIFVLTVVLMPLQIKPGKIELSYIFVDGKGIEYDIFEPVHGAATDWSFLFEDNEEGEIEDVKIATGTDNVNLENTDEKKGNNLEINNNANTGTMLNTGNETALNTGLNIGTGKDLNDKITNTGENKEIEDKIKEIETQEKDKVDIDKLVKDIEEINKNKDDSLQNTGNEKCITPWNTTVQHGESVIAYQQRSDVPNVCNAQRRSCNNGVLNGTFDQGACQEEIDYKYNKIKVISYNAKILSEFVQNPKKAKNDDLEFYTDGKIYATEKEKRTKWDNLIKGELTKDSTVQLTERSDNNCNSPRGEKVNHGQFIRAYQSQQGFTDKPCQVELRLCLNGNLNGQYIHKQCEYIAVTSQDYKALNTDVNESTSELLEEIDRLDRERKGFRDRIVSWFK